MGFFDGIVGSAVGLVGGVLGNKSSADEAQKSRDQSVQIAKHSHQWEVKDLKKAGLNPILSANSGASVSSLPVGSQVNPAAGIADSLNTANKIENIDKKIAESTIDLQSKSALNQEKQAGKNIAEQHLAETNELLSAENKKNAEANREVIRKNAELLEAQKEREFSQAGMNSAMAAKALSEAGLVNKQSKLIDYDIDAREYGKDVERYTAPADKIIDTIGNGLDTINPVRGLKGQKRKPK